MVTPASPATETMREQFRKCLTLVDPATVWQAVVVAGLLLLAVVLEMFGLGLIFAFVKLLVDPSQIKDMPWLNKVIGDAAANDSSLLITLALGLLAAFIAKNFILLGVYYTQARFVTVNEARLASRLFKSYLDAAYALHLTRNSAELIRNVTSTVTTVFSTVMVGFINLASEAVLIGALAAVLLIAEPVLTTGAVVVLGGSAGLFLLFFRRRIVAWGKEEQQAHQRILLSLQQAFQNIKEVKVLGRQTFVRNEFERPRYQLARIITKVLTTTNAPRLWVETVIVATVLLAVVAILAKGGNAGNILATLTLFAAATFRLIPSINRIIIAFNGIRQGSHALNLVYSDLEKFSKNRDENDASGGETLAFSDRLAMEGMSFKYPKSDRFVVKDVDLVLRKGESLGLVGPSGSGKSTLADIALGLLMPTVGRVTVDGVDIATAMRAWRRKIGYVPQTIYIIDDTLRRNVAFGLADRDIDDDKVRKAVRLAQLEELVRDLPKGLDTRLGERGIRLSGGQRQRVGIARALYRDPDVLILDEATSSLDSETEHEINNAIERLTGQKTLIIIAHRLSTVRKCSRLAYMRDGRLVDSGNFDELSARNVDFNRMVELARL